MQSGNIIDEERLTGGPPHPRVRKRFTIQSRHMTLAGGRWSEWRTWSRYETAHARDTALPGLQRKHASIGWEFRKGDDK